MALVAAPFLVFAVLAGFFAYALYGVEPSRIPSVLIGKPAPTVDLPPVEGLRTETAEPVPGFATADLATGGPLVLNVWASWCAPCHAEHPLLVQMAAQSGVPLIGLNYKDEAEAARRFLGRYGNPFARVGQDRSGRAAIEFGVYGVPETFVLNGRGEIVFKHVGPITPKDLSETFLPLLARLQAESAPTSDATPAAGS